MAEPRTLDEMKAFLARWRVDPVAFVREACGDRPDDDWQLAALHDYAGHDRLSVRSGHGIGKSRFVSWCILHTICTKFPAKVPVTGSNFDQLKATLWAEVGAVIQGMPGWLRDELDYNSESLRLKARPAESFAVIRTAAAGKEQGLAGFHCLAEDHEILTERGWLTIDEMTTGDRVLSVPPDGEVAEWMPVTAVHRHPFVGSLNVYDGKTVSFAVTDEHRFVTKYDPRKGGWRVRPLSEFRDKHQFMVRRVSRWNGEPVEVPPCFAKYGFDAERFARFVGFWTGDGGVHKAEGHYYGVYLWQMKGNREWLRAVLAGVPYREHDDHFAFSDRAVAGWLIENVGRLGATRRVPASLKNATPEVLDALCDGLWIAEGSITAEGERRQFYNCSRALIDDMQEILIKLGRPTTIGLNVAKGTAKVANGVEFTAANDCFVLSWVNRPSDHLVKMREVRREPYAGRVWCISTPYETFVTRRNGRPFWSGNSENVLVVVDEASAVADPVFEVLGGALTTAGAKLLLTGNPSQASGYFFESHTKRRHLFRARHVSCLDVRRVSRAWIEEQALAYGRESNVFRVRVLGEFPLQDADGVIPLDLLESAVGRDVATLDVASIWGLDPARFGDDRSALCKRQGNAVLEPAMCWQGLDGAELAGRVVQQWLDAPPPLRPQFICVDTIGVGASVYDHLKRTPQFARGETRIVSVNVAETAARSDKYSRLRDELWFKARDWFGGRDCKICDDAVLIGELAGPRYEITPAGKLQVESKDSMKRRGLRSPDCFIAGTMVLTTGGYRPIETIRDGDEVITPWAVRRVIRTWRSLTNEITTVDFSDGKRLSGKGKHQVFTWNAGFVRLDALSLANEIETDETRRLLGWRQLALSRIGGSGSGFSRLVDTFSPAGRMSRSAYCIAACGPTTTDPSRLGIMSITRMMIGRITRSATWSCCPATSTPACTSRGATLPRRAAQASSPAWKRAATRLASGISRMMGAHGMSSTASALGPCVSLPPSSVRGAAPSSPPPGPAMLGTAQIHAGNGPHTGSTTTANECARAAAPSSWPIGTGPRAVVPVRVQTVSAPKAVEVFNLTLDDDNVYYANGVLVRNCADAFVMTFAANAQPAREASGFFGQALVASQSWNAWGERDDRGPGFSAWRS